MDCCPSPPSSSPDSLASEVSSRVSGERSSATHVDAGHPSTAGARSGRQTERRGRAAAPRRAAVRCPGIRRRTRPRAHRRGECAMHPAMRITNRRGEVIGSVEEWGRLAAPASYKHWKPDRSAYELASAWSVGEGRAAIQRVLSRCPALAGVEPQAAIAEAQTRFDAFSVPRNHDLLIRAGEVIVSVEAKADETFGETIGEYRAAANARRERGEGTKAPERLEGLLAALVPPGASAADSLRYQLFSATAGALAEAHGARAAVVVIHDFVTPATSPAKRKANSADLRAFLMELFGAKPPRATEWCIGPFRVPGSDRIPGDVDLYFAKVVTSSFQRWTRKWLELGAYQGREVPGVDERIERIATLWSEPVPGDWRRGADERILDPAQRYCRTHSGDPRGEHRI